METQESIRKLLKQSANQEQAKLLQRYFKTGSGEYGEGDIFLGIKVPQQRKIAKKYKNIDSKFVNELLCSKIHDERAVALFILILQYKNADESKKQKIFNYYLKNTKFINNWDLVDLSAPRIIGDFLKDKEKLILYNLAKSKNLWERRISIISTLAFIKDNQFEDTLKIAEILMNDKHDLIHKAVGWALREVGKRDLKAEDSFLRLNYKKMPRTMLRYAIEKFPEKQRKAYLQGEK